MSNIVSAPEPAANVLSFNSLLKKDSTMLSSLDVWENVHNIITDNMFYLFLKNGKYANFSENVYDYISKWKDNKVDQESVTYIQFIIDKFLEDDEIGDISELASFSFVLMRLWSDIERFLDVALFKKWFISYFNTFLNNSLNKYLYQNTDLKPKEKIYEAIGFLIKLQRIKDFMPIFDCYPIQDSILQYIKTAVISYLWTSRYDEISLLFSRWITMSSFLNEADIVSIFDIIEDHIFSLTCIQDAEWIMYQVDNLKEFFSQFSPIAVGKSYKEIKTLYDELPFDPYRDEKVIKFSSIKNS